MSNLIELKEIAGGNGKRESISERCTENIR